MLRMKCEMVITDKQVIGLFRIFLNGTSSSPKPSKKEFLDYVRTQLILFGTDEFLVGTSVDENPELTDEQESKLRKWGLIG